MIGVVCGFKGEIECFHKAVAAARLSPELFSIRASGSSSKRARDISNEFIRSGAKKLISFGIAGGLNPALRAGDTVFSTHVVTEHDQAFGKRPAAAKQSQGLRFANQMQNATVLGVNEVITSSEQKAKLYAVNRAAAVDMESHTVAEAATANGLSFFVLRAISDSVQDTLPSYVINAVDEAGNPKILPILMGLAANPTSLPQLLRLKKNTDRALLSLEEAATRILPTLVK